MVAHRWDCAITAASALGPAPAPACRPPPPRALSNRTRPVFLPTKRENGNNPQRALVVDPTPTCRQRSFQSHQLSVANAKGKGKGKGQGEDRCQGDHQRAGHDLNSLGSVIEPGLCMGCDIPSLTCCEQAHLHIHLGFCVWLWCLARRQFDVGRAPKRQTPHVYSYANVYTSVLVNAPSPECRTKCQSGQVDVGQGPKSRNRKCIFRVQSTFTPKRALRPHRRCFGMIRGSGSSWQGRRARPRKRP